MEVDSVDIWHMAKISPSVALKPLGNHQNNSIFGWDNGKIYSIPLNSRWDFQIKYQSNKWDW